MKNKEAEISVLVSVILGSNPAFERIVSILKPSDFYYREHQVIFEQLLEIYKEGKQIDSIMLDHRIENDKTREYLFSILNTYSSYPNPETYAEIVREKSSCRQLKVLASEIIKKSDEENIHEIPALLQQAVEIYENTIIAPEPTVKDLCKQLYLQIEKWIERPSEIIGIETGLEKFDYLTMGLQPALHIIAGRPGGGKSSLALQIAVNASKNKKSVVLYSCEMRDIDLLRRAISQESNVSTRFIKSGAIDEEANKRILTQMDQLSKTNLQFVTASHLFLHEITADARRRFREKRCDLVILDYLQLVRVERLSKERYLAIGQITAALVRLWQQCNIPVIALSQVNRQLDRERDPRPRLADLKESGNIEQDADNVYFLYPNMEIIGKQCINDLDPCPTILEIAKNRDGELGRINVDFQKRFTKFIERSRQNGQ